MRRIAWVTALALALVAGVAAGALGADSIRKTVEVEYKGIQINVDGKAVTSDAEPFVLVDAGRTFVPARALAEALGAKVTWDANTNTVVVYSGSYVKSTAAGDWTTWTMPAKGFSFQAPPTLKRQDSASALLQVVAADGSLALTVQRLSRIPTMTAAQIAEGALTAAGKALGSGTITDRSTLTVAGLPAASVTGSYTAAGTPVIMRFVLVEAADTNWGLIILTISAAQAKNQPAIDHFISSFTLG